MRSLPIVAPEERSGVETASEPLPERRELQDTDLHDLLVEFYATVARDELLAPYFVAVDMRDHIPRIANFWSTIIFHTQRYSDNAFRPHAAMPGLTRAHFSRWLAVLEQTVDRSFTGVAAERMKALGHRVAESMQMRLRLDDSTQY
ncbi:MAG TPA: group III truncated hemoglobin [Gemmatimonadales bacterium]|nr:group III truncated hemoglobin [Gemmatimonadales bacterium]